jgi:hypothetical protein
MGLGTIHPFAKSMKNYERWLAGQVDQVWEHHLREKHQMMRENAFVFLRATYWRWAETILQICSGLGDAPSVLAVGDIHLENYGVWRDREGRLVWGVNDFDEAADMPYTVDLVRLATSAMLSRPARRTQRKIICSSILMGYREGLHEPRPFVLDEEHSWLRALLAVSEDERARFWKKIDKLQKETRVPARYRKPIEREMPGADARIEKFARRAAGTGSLGRPRWVGVADWRGGRLVREAKAILPSAWTLTHPQRSRRLAGVVITAGRYRAPDPWYMAYRNVVVRRLSPNARKIELREHAKELVDPHMLSAMGHELANVHLGTGDVAPVIERDLDARPDLWLHRAMDTAADFVTMEFEQWRG